MKKIYLNTPEVPVFDPAFPLPNISFINHVAEEPSWMAGPSGTTTGVRLYMSSVGRLITGSITAHILLRKGISSFLMKE